MGFFSALFDSNEVISKGTDAVISAGDKLFYTEEEKADMNIKLRELHIKTLDAYQPFKIAQRLLAVWYSFLFGIAFLVGLFIAVMNVYFQYNFDTSLETSKTLVQLSYDPIVNIVTAFGLSGIVMAIVSFYFLGGTIESFKRGK